MLRDRLADWLEPQLDELRDARPEAPRRARRPRAGLLGAAARDRRPGRRRLARAGAARPRVELSSRRDAREDDSLSAPAARRHSHASSTSNEAQRFATADLIDELGKIEESPWGDWYGKPISPQALSKLLRPYRIKTMPVWVDGETVRGYKLEQFVDAWERFLPVAY